MGSSSRIIVDKVTDPVGDAQEFDFDASWLGTNPAEGESDITLADATEPFTSEDLVPGTYSVSELVPDGWDLISTVCTSSNGDTETAGSISLQAQGGKEERDHAALDLRRAAVTGRSVGVRPVEGCGFRELVTRPGLVGRGAIGGASSFCSTMSASVVSSREPTLAAFWMALRTRLPMRRE